MAWHLAGTIIISFLVLARIYHIPYLNPDYNSPLIYWWGYCNLSITCTPAEAGSWWSNNKGLWVLSGFVDPTVNLVWIVSNHKV